MKIKHKKGNKLYIPSAYYIDRGWDDFEGGLATIESFDISKTLPEDHYNSIFISFKESPSSYNYRYVLENQEKWKQEYADKIAHPSPDGENPNTKYFR